MQLADLIRIKLLCLGYVFILIQLTDSDHLLCPYVQKSTDSKKTRAKLSASHMSGSFSHCAKSSNTAGEKCRGVEAGDQL